MGLSTIVKCAAIFVLGASLVGCVDAEVDVAVTSDSTARATLTQIMGADFYAMVKMNAAESEASEDDFCAEGELTENADGSATCVIVEEGDFATIAGLGDGENAIAFTSAGPGLVRVALPTEELTGEIGAADEMDAETRQMVEAFFAGRAITIRISGGEITETNMDKAADGQSAAKVLPFLDLINGTAELPAELYAIVRAP